MGTSHSSRSHARRVLLLAGVGLAAIVMVAGMLAWTVYDGARVSTVGEVMFENELVVPPLLEGELDAEGDRVFDLAFEAGTSEFLAGRATPTRRPMTRLAWTTRCAMWATASPSWPRRRRRSSSRRWN